MELDDWHQLLYRVQHLKNPDKNLINLINQEIRKCDPSLAGLCAKGKAPDASPTTPVVQRRLI